MFHSRHGGRGALIGGMDGDLSSLLLSYLVHPLSSCLLLCIHPPPVLSYLILAPPSPLCVVCRFHDWRVDVDGKILAQGAATDAEQDMAVTLVFAQHLVNRGKHLSLMLGQGGGKGKEGGTALL